MSATSFFGEKGGHNGSIVNDTTAPVLIHEVIQQSEDLDPNSTSRNSETQFSNKINMQ
jgi:hypothetical protein